MESEDDFTKRFMAATGRTPEEFARGLLDTLCHAPQPEEASGYDFVDEIELNGVYVERVPGGYVLAGALKCSTLEEVFDLCNKHGVGESGHTLLTEEEFKHG